MMRISMILISVIATCIACEGEAERYEAIGKLRALGVAGLPVTSPPSTEAEPQLVTLRIYAGLPVGQTVKAEALVDDRAAFSLPILAVINEDSETYQEKKGLQIYEVTATFVVPTADKLFFQPGSGAARLRYGIKLSTEDEEEKILGDYLVYPPGAPQLSWQSPELEIVKPSPNQTHSESMDIEIAITDSNAESIRVGWFASAGEIENRRAAVTKWRPEAGAHTLIATIRGRSSGAFTFKTVDIEK